jgi:hypothetical protein
MANEYNNVLQLLHTVKVIQIQILSQKKVKVIQI